MDTGCGSRWGNAVETSLCERRWRLDRREVPNLAAHVVTERAGYTHHGVYIGGGRVVHYAGLSRVWLAQPVEEVSLAEFGQGRAMWVQPHLNPRFTPEEVVARAKSRLGEDDYRITSNNCEHFCEWCVQGESRSRQIEVWRRMPKHLGNRMRLLVRRVQRLLSLDPWNDGWAV